LTDDERARIAELAATRLPGRLIAKEVGRSHRAVWSYVMKLRQPAPAERRRSLLRLSLAEREEISRGLAGGESFRVIAARFGRVERHSRFVMLVELPHGHSADVVADALARHITALPQQLRRSLTLSFPRLGGHRV
jgi:IS30 family transposase